MHAARRIPVLAVLCGAVLLLARPAGAQLRWDVGAQAGVTRRFTTGAAPSAPEPGFGPSFGLQGHVALVPMVRIGLYLEQDVSPASPQAPRTFWAGGLHLRVTPPLLSGAWRTWLFAGFGGGYTYSLERHAQGGIFDVPVGLGLGRKILGTWLVFVELGARFGLGFYGPMYDGAAGSPSATGGTVAPAFLGQDSFALSASVGLSLDQ